MLTVSELSKQFSSFGSLDSDAILISNPLTKAAASAKPSKKPKKATAVIPFRQIGAAFAAVSATGEASKGLEGVDVSWAGGAEPPILSWLREHGELGKWQQKQSAYATARSKSPEENGARMNLPKISENTSALAPFSSFPSSFVGVFLRF